MKKGVSILTVAMIVSANTSFAASSKAQKATAESFNREEVKAALIFLFESGALTVSKEGNAKIDRDMLNELRKDGTLSPSDAMPATICTDIIE